MEEKKRRMNIILGIILQIYFLFPWMNITGERKNFIMYVIAVLRNHSCADTYNTTFLDGVADALPLDIHTLAKTFTVCVMLYVVLEVIETIRLICNIKGWEIKFLSIIELIGLFAMLSVVAEIGLNSSWSSAGTIQVFPMYLLGYLAVFPIWTGIRLLMHKSMEEWEESGEQILKTQENDKHYKQERKRRLYFPGKYSKLYYHVLWENFKYHWRDFSFLFVSVLLSAAFLFIGFGMREAFSGSYGYDNELLGLGLTEIMKDCLIVIHVCVMSFFSVKVVSNRIADKTDTLYPYDYVWLANSNDTGIIEKLKQECKAEVTSIPMVRATTIDNTERLEGPFDLVWQQGQNIGISESSYRKLKKAVGEKPKKHLNLDKNGKKIYVVYQQDQGTKAKPIDHYQLMIHPNLHIGQPLFGFDTMEHQTYYPVRTITGSETSSLIGAFKQGKYENLIVFADAYFDKIKDYWKTTDMSTGEKIKTSDAVLEENIHEWPTKLVLANVPEKYQKKADQLTIDFAKQHAYDESFDSLVKSTYTKTEAAKKRQMERILECVMNGFVLIILSVISMLLLHMKVQMELPDMRKRYQFMNRLGMNRRERICIEKKEISRFVTIPSVIAVIVTVLYSGIVFGLRDYHLNDVKNYVINAGVLWIIYFILQWLNLKWLEDTIVKKIEKGADL
jgi:hypothetical protein